LQEGDRCFSKGDYACAKTKYAEAFDSASGKDKQVVEIKLSRANWCAERITLANQAYNEENYQSAKEYYQSVLDSNPDDLFAKSQLERCTNVLTTLSVSKDSLSFTPKGGKSQQISVQTNAEAYSVDSLPSWCTVQTDKDYFVITCSANSGTTARRAYFTVIAGGKTLRVHVSQAATTLSVSSGNIFFTPGGGYSGRISVQTNADTYSVDSLPSWCTVRTDKDYFVITCSPNHTYRSRSDCFKVVAGNKEAEITVSQSHTNILSNFNNPKGDVSGWGVTLGVANSDRGNSNSHTGGQIGLRFEPLYKYGFGLNAGLNLGFYSYDYDKSIDVDVDVDADVDDYDLRVVELILNFNAGLEYRLNFSRWFNVYLYGGTSFDLSDSSFYVKETQDSYEGADGTVRFFKYVDLGAGFRIDQLQFNAIGSILWDSFDKSFKFSDFYSRPQKVVFSVSYMFLID
jgi:hypothetical protein